MSYMTSRTTQSILDIEHILYSEVDRLANLCMDTRLLQPGDVFLAYPVGGGVGRSDNRMHIPQALASGAAIVLYENTDWDEHLFVEAREVLGDVRCIPVPGLAQMAGAIAANWYQNPSSKLQVIGVTGTNGKTTVTHWITQALNQVMPTALLGTLGYGRLDQLKTTGFTTPDACRVQRVLAELKAEANQSVAMEVSSHALEQGRVNAVQFDMAIFTNLTQDHLDYHGDMRAYEEAKFALFEFSSLAHIAININDETGRAWLSKLITKNQLLGNHQNKSEAKLPTFWLYGSQAIWQEIPHEIQAVCTGVVTKDIVLSQTGMQFLCRLEDSWYEVKLSCLGEFNVQNALAVLCALLANQVPIGKAIQYVESLRPVSGRLELINPSDAQHPMMVVDFAHTTDALEKTLETLLPIAKLRKGKLICVFGCGGNRDKSKRALMGAIAARLADKIIITSDNPRFEDPHLIMNDILCGISSADLSKVQTQVDRANAILSSARQSAPEDVVLVAGKGHENTQELEGRKFPFSDQDHICLAIGGLR